MAPHDQDEKNSPEAGVDDSPGIDPSPEHSPSSTFLSSLPREPQPDRKTVRRVGPGLHPIDRMLLRHCEAVPRPLRALLARTPRGSLYRHLEKLLQSGCLKRYGHAYQTTTFGQRLLAEAEMSMDWTVFERIYAPFASAPTAYHRGLLELILAAAVARQAAIRDDHHPGFIAIGRTLRGKTTLARTACAMLGLDPGRSLIDLCSESGRSVFVRRTGHGQLLSERSVLSSPLVIFDDFLQASPAVRATIGPFLSGRRTIPYENGVITIECVTLLTMNPRDKPTLAEQTTLNPAQLRRLIICNFDAIVLPDLALTGHRTLDAAIQQGPLKLPPLRTDLHEHRGPLVQVLRGVVRPELHDRIDSDMILLLAAGMTAFIDDDERAVQQAVYDAGLMFDTLGWTMPECG